MNGTAVKIIVLAALAAVCGCGQRKGHSAYRPTLENPDASCPPAVGEQKRFMEMAKDDVIVWVDGSSYTRKDLEDSVAFVRFQLQKFGGRENPKKIERIFKTMVQRLVPAFVEETMLVHEARNRKLLTGEELEKRFETGKREDAKKLKTTVETAERTFPGGPDAFGRLVENVIWRDAMMKVIPPIEVVNDTIVSNFMADIAASNRAAAFTNEMRRAELKRWRAELAAGKISFEDMAEQRSQCPFKIPGDKGDWGAWARDEFKDVNGNAKMGEAIFRLNEGEVSDVLEDEQGFSLVKFVKYDENDKDNSKSFPDRVLSRIFLPKLSMLVEDSFEDLKKSMTEQLFEQGVRAELEKLSNKYKVIYPHGNDFFGSSRNRAAEAFRAARAKKSAKKSQDRQNQKKGDAK